MSEIRCNPYCTGWRHQRGCPGEQAWDIPEACTCTLRQCPSCRAARRAVSPADGGE